MIWTLFLEHSIEQKVCPLCDATYIFLFWNPSQATCLSLLFSVLFFPLTFKIIVILIDAKWYLIVVLICISLMTNCRFPGCSVVKNSTASQFRRRRFVPCVGKFPQRKVKVKVKFLSCVWLFAVPRTVTYQAPLIMGFFRQECWSGLPFPSRRKISRGSSWPRDQTQVSCIAARSFTIWATREGHGNPLQYSCLENHMVIGGWQATVYRVARSQTQLKWLSAHACNN